MNSKEEKKDILQKALLYSVGGVAAGGFLYFVASRYKTSKSNEWLVRTGLNVVEMDIGKQFVQWPFQNIQRIDMTPKSFKFAVNAMSREKMEFHFPAVFTIGPKNNEDALRNYSRFLLAQQSEDTDALVRGIIEGETRTLSANLPIEEIFTGRSAFKNEIVQHVQNQLNQYGLEIYNANIEELKDSESSNYFRSLSQKIKAEAENKAKVEVAEQNKKGNIGAKERDAETRQRVSIVEAETVLVENSKQQEILKSSADMQKTQAEQSFIIEQAKIKAIQEAEIIKMKLQKDVELQRQEMILEQQRGAELTKSKIQAESQKLMADADLYKQEKDAEGILYKTQKDAEGNLFKIQKEAEGHLVYKQKEAEGLTAFYTAQAEGLKQLVNAFSGDTRALISYTMLDKGLYEKLAESNAKAIKDLNPKITVWTHDPATAMNPIQNLGKSLIPMLDTIQDQTGYSLPDWLVKTKKEFSNKDEMS
jgi:flotillin